MKDFSTNDDANLRSKLGARYALTLPTAVKYSLQEIKAAQTRMRAIANSRPDGDRMGSTFADIVNNQAHAYVRQGGETLMLAMQVELGDLIGWEVADEDMVQQSQDKREDGKTDGNPEWQAGKVQYSEDPDRGDLACSAGFVWRNGNEYYGSTAGHCVADFPYTVSLGVSGKSQPYGQSYNSLYWREMNGRGYYTNDIAFVRGDPATNYTAPKMYVHDELSRLVSSTAYSYPGMGVCRSGWTTKVKCGRVYEMNTERNYNRDTGVASEGLTCTRGAASDFGDSGAPYYGAPSRDNRTSAVAVGIHSTGRLYQGGQVGGCYSEVQNIQGLTGYAVLTQ